VRVEVFVDGSNFQPALGESGITHAVSFEKLGASLCDTAKGEQLVMVHYASGTFRTPQQNRPGALPGEYADRLGRYNSVEGLLRRVEKEPSVKVHRDVYLYRTPDAKDPRPVVEKGTDVRVALLMYQGAIGNRYDRAVLVASDADYVPAVEMVRALNKEVVWAHVSCHAHIKALRRAGAIPLLLTPDFLANCIYIPASL
jgi:uncharacterized LabA/DUF88 family protein